MTTLLNLFQDKLDRNLPGTKILCDEAIEDASQLQLVINPPTPDIDKTITVTLPNNTYEAWSREALQSLLNEMLLNCHLTLTLGHQEAKYEAYLQEVKTTKEKLLPHKSHRIDGLEYAIYYSPSIGGGGDYIDIMDLRAARRRAGFDNNDIFWGGSLFDVSGHGPGAAVEVAMIDAILRTYEGGPDGGPGNVMTYVNKHFFTRQRRGGFVTGILFAFNATEHIFTYSIAGHPAPIIKRLNGEIKVLDDQAGIPVGIDPDTTWETATEPLHSGDTLIMLTDGITEARSVDNSEFGYSGILDLVDSHNMENPNSFMKDFKKVLATHVEGTGPQDDQTLVVIQLTH